jgi:hypothetical protein
MNECNVHSVMASFSVYAIGYWKMLRLNAAARPIPWLHLRIPIADILLTGKTGFTFLHEDPFREREFILMLSWNYVMYLWSTSLFSFMVILLLYICLMLLGSLMVIKIVFQLPIQLNISGPCFWNSVFAFWSTIRCSSRICPWTPAVQHNY